LQWYSVSTSAWYRERTKLVVSNLALRSGKVVTRCSGTALARQRGTVSARS